MPKFVFTGRQDQLEEAGKIVQRGEPITLSIARVGELREQGFLFTRTDDGPDEGAEVPDVYPISATTTNYPAPPPISEPIPAEKAPDDVIAGLTVAESNEPA